jgi:hypothetical protein
MSSVGSAFSEMSVSVMGEDDVPLEEALDKVFLELQQAMNYSHCNIREMAVALDADPDFKVAFETYQQLEDYIDDMCELFTELKSVSKQVLPKPNKEEKEWAKIQCAEKKARQKLEKEREKAEAKQEKEQVKLSKIEEKENNN